MTTPNATYLDSRAGAFCKIKVNATWWEEDMKDMITQYFYEEAQEKELEDWEFSNEDKRDMFYMEWEDMLEGLTTKMLMGRIKHEDLMYEFQEHIYKYCGDGFIVPLWEETEEEKKIRELEKVIQDSKKKIETLKTKKIRIVKRKKSNSDSDSE
jgi:hypothetical protein